MCAVAHNRSMAGEWHGFKGHALDIEVPEDHDVVVTRGGKPCACTGTHACTPSTTSVHN